MIKKIYLFFCIFLFILPLISLADDFNIDDLTENCSVDFNQSMPSPIVNSKHVLVLDRNSEIILFEKFGFENFPMASTTKIMTATIILENCNLQDVVTISQKASSIHGSTLGIKANSKYTVEQLLYGLMLRSGNDCAIALAEHLSGSIENFSELMNQKAKELNLKNTNFESPHGLDSPNHYTSAYDLARLTNYALKNPTFSKIVSTKEYTLTTSNSSRTLRNTHELLGNLSGVYGVKTGFTFNAGRCLVTAYKNNNLDFIIVVLGAATKNIRTQDTQNLIKYILNTYEIQDISKLIPSSPISNIKIPNSNSLLLTQYSNTNNYKIPLNKKENNLKFSTYFFNNLKAPIKENDLVGYMLIYNNDYQLLKLDILAANQVTCYSFNDYIKNIIKKIKHHF